MEVKSVPWWRKALDFALSGIRSGFGLFSKTQKHTDEIEPETAAGHEEIREEEEATLTEHVPEQDSTVEAAIKIEVVAEPLVASDAEVVVEPEMTAQYAPEAAPQQYAESQPEEVPASEPEVEEEIIPDSEAAVEAPIAGPEASTETENTGEPEIEAEAVPVQIQQESALVPEIDESVMAVVIHEPIAGTVIEETTVTPEVATPPQEDAAPEPVGEESPLEDQLSQDEEPYVPDDVPGHQKIVKTEVSEVAAAEPEIADIIETISESGIETPVKPAGEAEALIANEEDQVTGEESATELTSGAAKVPESVKAEAEPDPPPEARDEFVAPLAEAVSEQVTEQRVSFKNVKVDEVAPRAESAMSEDSAPSPVPDESIEPVTQPADEAVPESVEEVTEILVDQAAEQIDEQTTEQGIEIDQVIAESMELNRPNSEPAEEPEQTADTAAPIAAEESATAATEASAPGPVEEAPAPNDEPEAPSSVTPAAQHPSKPFIKLEAREGEANASPFSVIVSQVYDGPLDLLLDLIRKQDIDIYDIPIARITAQFLAYVDQLKATDVDVAGEFIYTASLLIHIKSKMLLPRAPSGPDDAAEDPRRELVERLLEHERFKNAAQMLQQKQMLEAATWTNPGMREFKEDVGTEPEIAADTTDLVRVFQDILERLRNRPVLNVEEDTVTVGQMIQFLSRRLTMEDKPIALRKLLSHTRSERALIAMFLALLELVRLQAILLRQDRAFSEIFIKKHSNFENLITESPTHDTWK